MTVAYRCMDCLFAEKVEDEDYMACQARQALIMPFDEVCDFFETKGCVCEECAVTMDRNGVNEYLKDEYTNSSCDCGYCKGTKFNKEAMLDDTNCNANSYRKESETDEALEFLMEDLKESYLGMLETMAALSDGGKTQHVLGEVLGMEATIALIKRYLLELDD